MSATKAAVGQGAVFFTGVAGSPITYTAVLELVHIGLPEELVAAIDATHLKSPGPSATVGVMEYIPAGVSNPGTIDITGNYIGDTTQEAITTLLEAGTTFPFKTTAPNINGTTTLTVTGLGFFTKVKRATFEVGKKNDFGATLQITGPITAAIA